MQRKNTLFKVCYCEIEVMYKYKNISLIKKTVYKSLLLDSENNIVFMDTELIEQHKKIFTPKEKNKILALSVKKIITILSDKINYNPEADMRKKICYVKFLEKLFKIK